MIISLYIYMYIYKPIVTLSYALHTIGRSIMNIVFLLVSEEEGIYKK
jgi:hypothetical protein